MKNILLIFFLSLMGCFAKAFPTKDFWIPQATTTASDRVKFDMNTLMSPSKSSGNGPYGTSDVGVNLGVFSRENASMEAGIDWSEPSPEETIAALRVHARAVAFNLEENGFAVALGIDNLGFKQNVSDFNIIYLMFENYIGDDWEMALSAYVGNASLLVDEKGESDNRGVMAGLWRYIERRKGKFGFELVTGRNELAYLFTGFKFEVKPQVTGTLAYGFASNRYFRDWLEARLTLEF